MRPRSPCIAAAAAACRGRRHGRRNLKHRGSRHRHSRPWVSAFKVQVGRLRSGWRQQGSASFMMFFFVVGQIWRRQKKSQQDFFTHNCGMSIPSIADDLRCCCSIGLEHRDDELRQSRLLTPRRGIFEQSDQLGLGNGSTVSLYSSRDTLHHEKSHGSSSSSSNQSKIVTFELPFIAELYMDPVQSIRKPTQPVPRHGKSDRATDFIAELQTPPLFNEKQAMLSHNPKNPSYAPSSFIAEMVDQHKLGRNRCADNSDSDDESTTPPSPPLIEGWTEDEQAIFLDALRTIGSPTGRRTSGPGFREWMAAVSGEVCSTARK